MKNKKLFLKKLIISIIIVVTLTAGVVFVFDPFYHYHKPIKPLKAVLTQAEYQVIGTLRTFDYDSLIAGSSMAENYNNRWFDETFDCTAIKAVKPGANTSDLMYLLEAAYEEREIKNVFYTLDISALTTIIQEHFVNEGMDEGPIIAQKAVYVQEDDTPEILQRRVMEEAEWILLPQAIDDIANGRICVIDNKVKTVK